MERREKKKIEKVETRTKMESGLEKRIYHEFMLQMIKMNEVSSTSMP